MSELDNFIPYLMRRSLTRLEEAIAYDLATIGLNHERWRVLLVLTEVGPLTLNQLAIDVSIKVSTLSRLIDRMVEEGLVARRQSGIGRAVSISITTLGSGKLKEIGPLIADIDSASIEGLSPKRLASFKAELRKLYARYDSFAAKRLAAQAGWRVEEESLRPLRSARSGR